MKSYRYLGQRYVQGDSDTILFSFCANAADIRRWGRNVSIDLRHDLPQI